MQDSVFRLASEVSAYSVSIKANILWIVANAETAPVFCLGVTSGRNGGHTPAMPKVMSRSLGDQSEGLCGQQGNRIGSKNRSTRVPKWGFSLDQQAASRSFQPSKSSVRRREQSRENNAKRILTTGGLDLGCLQRPPAHRNCSGVELW